MRYVNCLTHVRHPMSPDAVPGTAASEPCIPVVSETLYDIVIELNTMILNELKKQAECFFRRSSYSKGVQSHFFSGLPSYVNDFVARQTENIDLSDSEGIVIDSREIVYHEFDTLLRLYETAEPDDVSAEDVEKLVIRNMSICGRVLTDMFESATTSVAYRIVLADVISQ